MARGKLCFKLDPDADDEQSSKVVLKELDKLCLKLDEIVASLRHHLTSNEREEH